MERTFKTEIGLNRQYLESIHASKEAWIKTSDEEALKLWVSNQTTYTIDQLAIDNWVNGTDHGWDIYLKNTTTAFIKNVNE